MRVEIDEIEAQVKALATLLRPELAKRPSVAVYDQGVEQRGHEARLGRIDLPGGGADAFVRASPHCYNDGSDVERFVRSVAG